jgi:putative membrane protein
MPSPATVAARTSDRTFYVLNAILSAAALGFIAYLLLIRRGGGAQMDLRFVPAVNAGLNTTSALLLSAGWIAIRRKAVGAHRALVTAAFIASSLFLVCYLGYHYAHGNTKYAGTGPLRAIYFLILASHVILSMGVVPMALAAFYFALKKEFVRHRRVTRILMPVWLYVSVTGVVVFFMLRGSAPAAP